MSGLHDLSLVPITAGSASRERLADHDLTHCTSVETRNDDTLSGAISIPTTNDNHPRRNVLNNAQKESRKAPVMIPKNCLECRKTVMVYPNNGYTLGRHIGSDFCKKKQARLERLKTKEITVSITRAQSEQPIPYIATQEFTHRRTVSDSNILQTQEPPSRSPSPSPDLPICSSSAPPKAPETDEEMDASPSFKSDLSSRRACRGISLPWIPGSIHKRYPFAIHGTKHDPGYQIMSFRKQGKGLWVRASKCLGGSGLGRKECANCRIIPVSKAFRKIVEQALHVKPHTAYVLQSQEQLEGKAGDLSNDLKKARLEVSYRLESKKGFN
jgi:hypothetical protein